MALTQVSTGGIKNATITNDDVASDAIQLTKLQNMANNHILGRSTSGTGNPEVLSAASVRSILNVADGATASSSTTINNNSNNRIITGSNTANTLEGEANLTYNGQLLQATNSHINISSGYSYQWGDSHERIQQSDGKIEFFTGNTEKMTLSGSHLGINTTSPSNVLDVKGSGHAKVLVGTTGTVHATGLQISHAIGAGSLQEWQLQTDASADGNLIVRNATTGTSTMFFDADNNNVGIGTTSPAKKLHVFESGVATIQLETGDSRGQAFNILSTNGAGTNTCTLSIRNEAGQSFIDMSHNGGSPFTNN